MAKARAGQRYVRRHWLVNPPLQYQFIGVMLLVLLLLTIGALGAVYLALWLTLETFGLGQDAIAVAQLSTVGLLVTLELLLLSPLVVWVGIRLTHRVAGPLVRINAAVQQMARGDYNVHITLRDGDALVELADALNQLAASLRSRRS
jgi:signal transduction histidine kinase